MKHVRICIEFEVDDKVKRAHINSIAGDAYVQINEAVLRDKQGNEHTIPTKNVTMEVKF